MNTSPLEFIYSFPELAHKPGRNFVADVVTTSDTYILKATDGTDSRYFLTIDRNWYSRNDANRICEALWPSSFLASVCRPLPPTGSKRARNVRAAHSELRPPPSSNHQKKSDFLKIARGFRIPSIHCVKLSSSHPQNLDQSTNTRLKSWSRRHAIQLQFWRNQSPPRLLSTQRSFPKAERLKLTQPSSARE